MNKYEIRLKRRKELIKNRLEAYHTIMKKYPNGITKDNFEEIKSAVLKEAKRLKRES